MVATSAETCDRVGGGGGGGHQQIKALQLGQCFHPSFILPLSHSEPTAPPGCGIIIAQAELFGAESATQILLFFLYVFKFIDRPPRWFAYDDICHLW